MFSYIINEEKIKYISTMNKCKRKKLTILESFIISLERKKKIASTILKKLNMLLLYLIVIQYIYIYIYIYVDTISLTSNISLNCSKCLRFLYFLFSFFLFSFKDCFMLILTLRPKINSSLTYLFIH